MAGLFITFEGVEGAGKSTQISVVNKFLTEQGHEVVLTREPGGTTGAERIRDLLVNGTTDQWSDMTECLLMNAARAENLEKVIRPALAAGKTVLCDRFMDSTRAYQGAAGGIDMGAVRGIERAVVGDTQPDMTFIFDISVETGLARAASRGGEDRFERKGTAYHEKVRQGFLAIAAQEPRRGIIVDAAQAPEAVSASLLAILRSRLAHYVVQC